MITHVLLAQADPNFVQQMPTFAPTDWSFEAAKWTMWILFFAFIGLVLKGFGLL